MAALRKTDSNKPINQALNPLRCRSLVWSSIFQNWHQCRNYPKRNGFCTKHKDFKLAVKTYTIIEGE